jgi:hypothetical protein
MIFQKVDFRDFRSGRATHPTTHKISSTLGSVSPAPRKGNLNRTGKHFIIRSYRRIFEMAGQDLMAYLTAAKTVPVAMLAVLLHGEWQALIVFVILIVLTFGLRGLGFWLAKKVDQRAARLSFQRETQAA